MLQQKRKRLQWLTLWNLVMVLTLKDQKYLHWSRIIVEDVIASNEAN